MSLKLLLSMVPTPWLALVDLQLMAYLMIRKQPSCLISDRRLAVVSEQSAAGQSSFVGC